jgi:hypothetical protein
MVAREHEYYSSSYLLTDLQFQISSKLATLGGGTRNYIETQFGRLKRFQLAEVGGGWLNLDEVCLEFVG